MPSLRSQTALGTISRLPIRTVGMSPFFAAAYEELIDRPTIPPASGTVKPNSPRGRGILSFLRFAIGVCVSFNLVPDSDTNCMIHNFFKATLDGTIRTGAMYPK